MSTVTTDTHAVATAGVPVDTVFGDVAYELANTRRLLERVPDGKSDWKPHAKSMSLGRLASHVAELPLFALSVVAADELDFAAGGGYKPRTLPSTADLLAEFDRNAAQLREAMARLDAAALQGTWTLRAGDHVIVSGPKGVLVRSVGLNHIIHHRAQLGVYLRLLDIPVPGLYGPSADES